MPLAVFKNVFFATCYIVILSTKDGRHKKLIDWKITKLIDDCTGTRVGQEKSDRKGKIGESNLRLHEKICRSLGLQACNH